MPPPGQSCGTCTKLVNGSCRGQLPSREPSSPAWQPMPTTEWCRAWTDASHDGQSCATCPSWTDGACHGDLPNQKPGAARWRPTAGIDWCAYWGVTGSGAGVLTVQSLGHFLMDSGIGKTIIDPKYTNTSQVFLQPLTASAAGLPLFVSGGVPGQFGVTAGSAPAGTEEYEYVIIG
jgi:hypothetical protein